MAEAAESNSSNPLGTDSSSITLLPPERLEPNPRRQDKIIAAVLRGNPRLLLPDVVPISDYERANFAKGIREGTIAAIDFKKAVSILPTAVQAAPDSRNPVHLFARFEGDGFQQRHMRRAVAFITRGSITPQDQIKASDLYAVTEKLPTALDFEQVIPQVLKAVSEANRPEDREKVRLEYIGTLDTIGQAIYAGQWTYLKQARILQKEGRKDTEAAKVKVVAAPDVEIVLKPAEADIVNINPVPDLQPAEATTVASMIESLVDHTTQTMSLTPEQRSLLRVKLGLYFSRPLFFDTEENRRNFTALSNPELTFIFQGLASDWPNVARNLTNLSSDLVRRVYQHLSSTFLRDTTLTISQKASLANLIVNHINSRMQHPRTKPFADREVYKDIYEYTQNVGRRGYAPTPEINGKLLALSYCAKILLDLSPKPARSKFLGIRLPKLR